MDPERITRGVISLTTGDSRRGSLGSIFRFLGLCVCLGVQRGLSRVVIKYSGNVRLQMLFSFKNKYHYTYPNTYIALYFSYAKVTCNTHKNKKLLSIPLKLVPSLAKLPLPYFPHSTGRSASSHPIKSFHTVHIKSGAGGRETYMCSGKYNDIYF